MGAMVEPSENDLLRWHTFSPGSPLPLDDSVGPIELRSCSGRGRGLFAAEDVPAGKLLLACRAFALAP